MTADDNKEARFLDEDLRGIDCEETGSASEGRIGDLKRIQFPVTPASWQELVQLLERPPKVPSGLRRLFSQPSRFEG